MSIKLVEKEIQRFLKSKDAEVICIKGKWGVGKTFAWRKYLENAQSSKVIGLKKYSYVSLFGQNSIEGLKNSIFENTISIDQLNNGPTLETLQKNLSEIKKWRKLAQFIPMISKVKDFVPALFLTIKNQIICIDDLERKGEGISTINIMGLISLLKEQRNCKIVLLLNDEEIENNTSKSRKDFQKHLEKVVDVDIRFEPTASEAADIGIDKKTPFYQKFKELCVGFNIVNIRIIKKIERLIRILEKLLVKHDKRILESSLPTLVLVAWSTYQPNLAPPIDYIRSFINYTFLNNSDKESEEQIRWRQLINTVGYFHFDQFDELLLNSVQNGYFDSDAVEKAAIESDKKFKLQDEDNSFHASWDKYHNSFECNEKEVLDEMFVAFKKNVQSISPMNADGTICLFRKFNRQSQADELVEYYMSQRNESKEFYDPKQSVFLKLKDIKLSDSFNQKLLTFKDKRSAIDILLKIAKYSGWNPEDISLLAQVSASQYYNIFKNAKGETLRIIVSQALKFKQYDTTNNEMCMISKNAEEALTRIAQECQINHERVSTFGIVIGDKDETTLNDSTDDTKS